MVNRRQGFWRIWVVLWVLWALFFGFIGLMLILENNNHHQNQIGGLAIILGGLLIPPLVWRVGDWIYRGFTATD